jgi:exopolyphosphatase/guanosine-5'-triphosphate,3'-diphosphate pyrophosphatase
VERAESGEPLLVTRDRVPVRLGAGAFEDGIIPEATIAAAEGALRRFAALCDQYGAQRVRTVATAALREARNRDAVVERLSAASPSPVEVISGTEEAWLLARAVERRVDLAHGRSLLLDLGGGSVELTLVQGTHAEVAESYPLGAVRLLQQARRQAGADHGADFVRLLEEHAARCDHRIVDRLESAQGRTVERLVACGGNVEALADLEAERGARRSEGDVEWIASSALDRWIEELGPLPGAERAARHGLLPDRADVIVPAAVVLRHLARLAGVKRLWVPRVGLRDGLQRDVVGDPDSPEALAERRETALASASALARRTHCDLGHAQQVRRHATALFDATAPLHGRDSGERTLLEVAALLHDVGRFVSSEHHWEHSAYLIRASELVGLRPAERERVALVARYHVGDHPDDGDPGYRSLGPQERAGVCVLAALLRLADAFDRRHRGGVERVDVQMEGGPGRVLMTLHAAPGAGRAVVELDAAREKGGLFEEVFGVRIELAADA